MLNWLKSVWAKWKIHITVVGGAVIVATTFGDCSFTPNLSGDDAADEEGAAEVEVTPAAIITESTATTEGETTTGSTATATDGTTTTSEDN